MVDAARPAMVAGTSVPVVTAADLVRLKLYAGGPQDAWDVDQLLDVVPAIEAAVERDVQRLPADAIALWRRILRDRA